ncbi:hypothetical protein ACP70R_035528 [Stipagrostis hirtigluma subsp. patula]
MLVESPELRASFLIAEPPSPSHLLVPAHLINPRPRPHPRPNPDSIATSGDGLLLLSFMDGYCTATFDVLKRARDRESIGFDMDPDVPRFVCNPLSGQMLRLPDIDGTRKTSTSHYLGLLTRSVRGHGPPDRYAVAELIVDHEGKERSFVMRRFLSETGEWE